MASRDSEKSAAAVRRNVNGISEDQTPAVAERWQGTTEDKNDMRVLGRAQKLRRNFRFLSIFALNSTLVASWAWYITSLGIAVTNGGTAGMLWSYIVVLICLTPVYLSIAEMASIAPTSGGQYHWVSEFAPPRMQKFLSYTVGWLSFTSWQAGVAGTSFLPGTVIQGMIQLNDQTYVYHRWHGTLLMIAVVTYAIFVNTLLAKRLPAVEYLLIVLYVLGFLAVITTLWVLAPTGNPDIWFQFYNGGGWNSDGTSTMIGLLSAVYSLLGLDCSVHMGIRDASRVIPRAILWSFLFNGIIGLVMCITLAYSLGDVDSVLNSASGYPFISILLNATKSYVATTMLTAVVVIIFLSAGISELATASRQLWSFSRDRGLPGHHWLAQVHSGLDIPLNAILSSFLATSLLSLINIASTSALNAILALTGVSFLSTYTISIGCILYKRIVGEDLPPSRFSLGRWWGMLCNIASLCFLLPVSVFAFFPPSSPTSQEDMNWAVVMFIGIMAFATAWYFIRGHKEYRPPVALVRRNR